jgi:hypothetical protein
LQLAHGRSNLAVEVVRAGDRHAANGIRFPMLPTNASRLRLQAVPTTPPIPGEPSYRRLILGDCATPSGRSPKQTLRTFAALGSADRLQRRVIPFAGIIFSDARTDSFPLNRVNTIVNILMADRIQQRKLEMITPIRPQGLPCDATNSLQLSACGPATGPPGKCRLKWVYGGHRKA